jgi:4-hydroxythreonine-4-phosphate dehydrogenase
LNNPDSERLAITCGDPAGIGPEVVAGWLEAHPAESHNVTVIGPVQWLGSLKTTATKIPVGLDEFVAIPGHPSNEGASVAWAAMERAAAGCLSGKFSGVVTGPVSKDRLSRIGYPFPGQTEFFAARWGGDPVMAFCGGRLRVVLTTWHVPLRAVPALLTPAALARSVGAAKDLAYSEGVLHPRIGVCGLNPHAGEGGLLGDEEVQLLNPILEKLRP